MQRIKDNSRINRIVHFSDRPQIGVPLGKFRIIIRLAGQRNHTELEGELYDSTSMFLNKLLVSDFKAVICDEIAFTHPEIRKTIDATPIREAPLEVTDCVADEKEATSAADAGISTTIEDKSLLALVPKHFKASLDDAVKAFREYPLSSVCRVLIMKQGFNSDKHIILQFGRLHPLIDYATIPDEMSRDFIRGQRGVQCIVNGEGLSLPTKRELPDGLGTGYIHWLIPDDPVQDSEMELQALNAAQILIDIVPWIHHDLETREIRRAYEDVIKSKDESLDEMSEEVKAKSTELDAYRKMLAAFRRHDNKNDSMGKKPDFYDFICYTLPTVSFFGLGLGIGGMVGSLGGLFLGLVVGAWFSYRRR